MRTEPFGSNPTVLVLALGANASYRVFNRQLFSGLRRNAILEEAFDLYTATRWLSRSPSVSAVIITHSIPVLPKHDALLKKLAAYTRTGGRVVVGLSFPSDMRYDEFSAFFHHWGLGWEATRYTREDLLLNSAGLPSPLRSENLLTGYSAKAVFLSSVDQKHVVYAPESHNDLNYYPAVWAPIGKGYLGYIGDVNAMEESIRLVLEMCGISPSPGDIGPGLKSLSSSGLGRGRFSTKKTHQSELSLPGHARRPREDEVTARAVKRADFAWENYQKAENLQEDGDELFGQGDYAEAAEKYREAVMAYGPRPAYLTKFADTYLKLKSYEKADSAATRALDFEHGNVKAHYCRGVALKELGKSQEAIKELCTVLQLDPSNTAARTLLGETFRQSKFTSLRHSTVIQEGHVEETIYDRDYETESDTSEFHHEGNGKPCRRLNHGGCKMGSECQFKHAPDRHSVRDELGRNVCLMHLLDMCTHKYNCFYAHDKKYLPKQGWWFDDARVAWYKNHAKSIASEIASTNQEVVDCVSNVYAAIHDWRSDRWADGYGAEAESTDDDQVDGDTDDGEAQALYDELSDPMSHYAF